MECSGRAVGQRDAGLPGLPAAGEAGRLSPGSMARAGGSPARNRGDGMGWDETGWEGRVTCAPLRVWWHRRCEGAGGSCGGAPWGCCALGEQPGAMGRAEGSDFEVGWSRHCQGWVLPCPPGIPALQVLPSLAGCAVSGGPGQAPAVGELRARFPGAVSGPCAGVVAAGGDTLLGLGSARPQPHAVEFAG